LYEDSFREPPKRPPRLNVSGELLLPMAADADAVRFELPMAFEEPIASICAAEVEEKEEEIEMLKSVNGDDSLPMTVAALDDDDDDEEEEDDEDEDCAEDGVEEAARCCELATTRV
jgi:hypothetical protein